MSHPFHAPRIRSLALLLACPLALSLLACPSADSGSEKKGDEAKPGPVNEPTPAPEPEVATAPAPGPDAAPAPAPAPGPLSVPAPAPIGVQAEEELMTDTPVPCATMSDARLHFEVDSSTGDIVSIDVRKTVSVLEPVDPTLNAVQLKTASTLVPIDVKIIGTSNVQLVDGAGQVQTIAPSPTGGAVPVDVNVPSGTTFSLMAMPASLNPTPKTPGKYLPPSSKKAIIKPVVSCPR